MPDMPGWTSGMQIVTGITTTRVSDCVVTSIQIPRDATPLKPFFPENTLVEHAIFT